MLIVPTQYYATITCTSVPWSDMVGLCAMTKVKGRRCLMRSWHKAGEASIIFCDLGKKKRSASNYFNLASLLQSRWGATQTATHVAHANWRTAEDVQKHVDKKRWTRIHCSSLRLNKLVGNFLYSNKLPVSSILHLRRRGQWHKLISFCFYFAKGPPTKQWCDVPHWFFPFIVHFSYAFIWLNAKCRHGV